MMQVRIASGHRAGAAPLNQPMISVNFIVFGITIAEAPNEITGVEPAIEKTGRLPRFLSRRSCYIYRIEKSFFKIVAVENREFSFSVQNREVDSLFLCKIEKSFFKIVCCRE
ncbi:hypothetical protein BRADI_4g13225v3 [Brachypodium distachyon]|uniref:Uncharacterized protein n=1 Tax=Brachypodium distachyon TaxID=15368 RepID=A0A2K2CMH8_BRADI|nr:hypothetical protein BRADI_4g13225v3 [Brachypodium distachyon]